jgi:choloylglycine hydrolase
MQRFLLLVLAYLSFGTFINACSIVYFIDEDTGKIYIATHEDYWYDVKDYLQVAPTKADEHARVWWGWGKFAQGGINDAGLFFDAAVTPKQSLPEGFSNPQGRNIGDEILANCSTVNEAVSYLRECKIAVSEGHLLFGDASGNALTLEWVNGEERIVRMTHNRLVATNFLLSDKEEGNYPCYRHASIEERADALIAGGQEINLLSFGNIMAGSAQPAAKAPNGKTFGTLYSSFINLTDMELVVVPRLTNEKAIKLDLKEEFRARKRRKIQLWK